MKFVFFELLDYFQKGEVKFVKDHWEQQEAGNH